jgi:hypothetical protein
MTDFRQNDDVIVEIRGKISSIAAGNPAWLSVRFKDKMLSHHSFTFNPDSEGVTVSKPPEMYQDGGVYRDADGSFYQFESWGNDPSDKGEWQIFGDNYSRPFDEPTRPLEGPLN